MNLLKRYGRLLRKYLSIKRIVANNISLLPIIAGKILILQPESFGVQNFQCGVEKNLLTSKLVELIQPLKPLNAQMAELVDVSDSKSGVRKDVRFDSCSGHSEFFNPFQGRD